jgi:hypothetical protein
MTRYLLLFDSYGLAFAGGPLWWEDWSVFCVCCWPSPAQSLPGPSPPALMTIFYCPPFITWGRIEYKSLLLAVRCCGYVASKPLSSNGLFRLSGVMSQYIFSLYWVVECSSLPKHPVFIHLLSVHAEKPQNMYTHFNICTKYYTTFHTLYSGSNLKRPLLKCVQIFWPLFILFLTLVRSKLEYAFVVWNYITFTDANKLERIQQKFTALCFNRFFLYVHYSYALKRLKSRILSKRRYHLFSILNYVLNFGNCSIFEFLLRIWKTFLCSRSAPQ